MFISEDWNLVHQTLLANQASTMFDVYEGLVRPWAIVVYTVPNSFSCWHENLSSIVYNYVTYD